jgi:hypothetical protein
MAQPARVPPPEPNDALSVEGVSGELPMLETLAVYTAFIGAGLAFSAAILVSFDYISDMLGSG